MGGLVEGLLLLARIASKNAFMFGSTSCECDFPKRALIERRMLYGI